MNMENRYNFSGQIIGLTCGNCEADMELNHMGFMTSKSIYHFHCVDGCGAVTTLHWFDSETPLPNKEEE